MSIATELIKLANNKAAIKAAIEAKDPPVMPTDNLSQWPTSIASLPGSQQLAQKLDSDAVANEFSTSSTYSVGNIVVYNGKRYKCIIAVETAGAWDSTKWILETVQTAIDSIDVSQQIQGKLDSTAAAPDFSTSSTYFVGDYVTYLGKLYRCKTAITTAGSWEASKWDTVDMTSPDATADITNDGFLRIVDANGTILWAEGYNLSEDSSGSMANWSVGGYAFAANATDGVELSLPTVMAGKVGDLILDVTNPALDTTSLPTAFSNSATYAAGDIVSYDSKLWRCVVAVETAGAWTGTINWEEAWPYITLSQVTAMTVSVVVPAGEDLQEMLKFAPGTMCELYFTQTAFNVDSKPTWKVVRQDVEDGGAS